MSSCFFSQNLMSDFLEELLPSNRNEELKRHLDGCKDCRHVFDELKQTLNIIKKFPLPAMHHELALRAIGAAETGEAKFYSRRSLSRVSLFLSIPILLFLSAAFTFPKFFPWISFFNTTNDEANFVRYYPLLQGAVEVIEEQGGWLSLPHSAGSLWEEGGLSPEEFEKNFQVKRPEAQTP